MDQLIYKPDVLDMAETTADKSITRPVVMLV